MYPGLTSVHVFPTVQGVPSPRLSTKCPHYCRVYAQGAAVTGAVGRWWRGITRTGQLSGCTAVTDNHRWGSTILNFYPGKIQLYLDINYSCEGGLIFDVVSDLRFVSATKQCLNKSGAALPVGDPNISHQNPAKHGVIICSSWAELMVSGFHFLL